MAVELHASAPPGGYEIDGATIYNKHGSMTKADLEHLLCSRCDKILRNAVQVTACGHRYCRDCLDSIVSDRYTIVCMWGGGGGGKIFFFAIASKYFFP